MHTSVQEIPATIAQKDFLSLQGTDYIEFYVGNAKQAAHYSYLQFKELLPRIFYTFEADD